MELSDLHFAALNAAANGVLIINRTGEIEWANPAVSRLTGYSLDELVGQTPRLFKSGAHPAEYYTEMWDTILAGRVWQGETFNRRKDGSLYTEEQTITPVRDQTGQITHFIAIKHDISRRKQTEAEITRANQELLTLSQSERTQREFAEALFNATLTINSRLELNEMLVRILEQTLVVIPCQAALLILIEQDHVRVVHHYGLQHIPQFAPLLDSPQPMNAFRIIRMMSMRPQPLIVANSYADPMRQNIPGLEWVISYAAAPLLADGQFIGVIVLMSDQEGYFPQAVSGLLSGFAIHYGLAIQHARIYLNEINARQTAEMLSAASLSLTQSLELENVLQTVLDFLEKLATFDQAAILLAKEEPIFQVVAIRGGSRFTDLAALVGMTVDASAHTNLEQIVSTRQGQILVDISETPGFGPTLSQEDLHSWIGAPLIAGGSLIGICALWKNEASYYTPEHLHMVEALVRQAAMAIQNAWLFEQVRAGRERLLSLSHRLVEVQENERRLISRELHDETGQALTSLKLGLRLLEKQAGDAPLMLATISDLRQQVEGILDNLHQLVMTLRPTSLDIVGLEAALRQHLQGLSEKYDLKVNFVALGMKQRLPTDIEVNLYRIVQEALTNVIRHSQARRVDVLLEHRDRKAIVMVEDDGVGFDPEQFSQGQRLGLFGMHERAEMLGGRLAIESHPQRGTTILVEVPL